MARSKIKKFTPLISLILFGVAIYVLYDEFQQYTWHQISEHLRLLPSWQYVTSVLLTGCVYLTLTLYDRMSFHYLGEDYPWRKILLGAFLGYSFSHNISPTLLVGGAIRYRIYSSMGISGMTVTNVVAFNAMSIWIGLMFLGAFSFITQSLALPEQIELPIPAFSLRGLGWVLLFALIIYFILTTFITGSVNFRGKTYHFPSLRVAFYQLGVSSMDWLLSSAVLFLLMPPTSEVNYLFFIGIYMVAFIVGLMSQVPGGLGVFETIVLLFLYPFMEPIEILSALILFRIIYFILPLITGAILLGVFELNKQRS